MRINIVKRGGLQDPQSLELDPLARMTAVLRDGLGWTVTDRPDDHADVNYFIPFTDYARFWLGYTKTKTAAIFFHREEYGDKVVLWDLTAKAVDLRIVNSEKYKRILEPLGKTARVCHPIDRARFKVAGKRVANDPPKIGLNGRVNTNGRKGEWMIPIVQARLARPSAPVEVQWEALGRDWPVPTRWVHWADVAPWYHSIDILMCTSILDAGPGGPYEALASGTPVIIPTDVGSLDELPNRLGIWRYMRGYPQHLADVLSDALRELPYVKREYLSEAVAWHNLDNWCAMHAKAMEMLA